MADHLHFDQKSAHCGPGCESIACRLVIGFDIKAGVKMSSERRMVTIELPDDLVVRMEDVAGRTKRSHGSIMSEALSQWLAEWQRRHELTLEALRSVDEGRTIPQEDIVAMMQQRKRERCQAWPKS